MIGVQVLTAIFSYRFVRNNVIEQGKNELSIASLVFMQQLDALAERISQDVEVLTLDFPLRQAIAHDDRETAFSALRNHGRRINAARMMLVELDGTMTVDTAHPDLADAAFPFPEMLKEASAIGRAMALTAIGDQVFWIVTVPVNAPVPIAFVAAGVPVNDALVEDLRRLSALPASIMLAVAAPDGVLQRSANSASHPPSLHGPSGMPDKAVTAITEDQGKEYLTLATPLRIALESAPVIAIFDYPLEDALARYQGIIVPVAIVFAIALLVAIPGAWLIARGVSRPVEALAETAHRIEAGDYSAPK
ncbi:MAG TPA: cache domain-containing protein, partial [Burkholderiales bacterium]|nr:cache domain-containing protein [Burkholderiales bacterium]